MTSGRLETYLSRLERELRKHGLPSTRIVEEAREHLVDAIEEGLQSGLSVDASEREAFVRFGAPELVAAHFATKRHRVRNRLLLMLASIARLIRRKEPVAGYEPHYHDVAVPSHYHFGLRLRRRYRDRLKRMSLDQRQQFIAAMRDRGDDVGAFQTDPRERLIQFLGTFGPPTLGPNATLESLTMLEDTKDSSQRCGKYLAAFTSGAKMIWTVVQTSDGSITLDGHAA